MSTPFDEPELDVQSTLLMWKEAYQRVDTKLDELESLAKRLALDLECILLNRDKWWDQAHETLLRQALEALFGQRGEPDWHTGKQRENTIDALRERLGEKA